MLAQRLPLRSHKWVTWINAGRRPEMYGRDFYTNLRTLDKAGCQQILVQAVPEGERWRAVEKESGISYVVDAELMDLLQAPLNDDQVMPLVPSLVTRIEINGPGGRYALVRQDENWFVQLLDATGRTTGEPQLAEAVEVRRFLRLLTSLRSLRSEPDAGPLAPDQFAGSSQSPVLPPIQLIGMISRLADPAVLRVPSLTV